MQSGKVGQCTKLNHLYTADMFCKEFGKFLLGYIIIFEYGESVLFTILNIKKNSNKIFSPFLIEFIWIFTKNLHKMPRAATGCKLTAPKIFFSETTLNFTNV